MTEARHCITAYSERRFFTGFSFAILQLCHVTVAGVAAFEVTHYVPQVS